MKYFGYFLHSSEVFHSICMKPTETMRLSGFIVHPQTIAFAFSVAVNATEFAKLKSAGS
jgi:hypothetical protein